MSEKSKSAYDFSADAAKVLFDVLLAAVPVALLYSIILLLVSLVLVIVMQKRRLYTREAKGWNLLTKLHYPLWMLLFAGLGFALGLVASMKSSADRAIDEKIGPVLSGMVPSVQKQVIESLPPELLAEGPVTGEDIYDYMVQHAAAHSLLGEDSGNEGLFRQMGRKMESEVRLYLTKMAIDQAIVKAGESAGLKAEQAEFSLEVFKSIDFTQRADEIAGKVTGLLKSQVAGFANAIRVNCFIYCGLLILLLLIEPLVYYLLIVPRKSKALAQAEAAAPDGAKLDGTKLDGARPQDPEHRQ